MNGLMWLIARITEMLLRFALSVCLDMVGCGVRLLYWSVRTYGWGRVAAFFAAGCLSVWGHQQLGWLSFSFASACSLAIGTLGCWGIIVGGYLWLARYWQQGVLYHRATLPAPASHPLANPCPASPMPQREGLASSPTSVPATSVNRQETASKASLWEQVISLATLQEAWQRVLVRGGGPGSDGVTVEAFALNAEQNLRKLAEDLANGCYSPHPPRWVEVPKRNGGTRRLAILCVRDRIAQLAVHIVLAPLWNERFAPCSYAYRAGYSALQAVAAVERSLAAGKVWVVDGDIDSFFDSVPHAPLFAVLREWLPNEEWICRLVQQSVTATAPTRGRGIAQGSPLSPLLANLYLHPFDNALLQAGYTLVRYADDFVILCPTRQQAETALRMAERLLNGLGLKLNRDKTRIVHRDEGFTFLGYVFTREGKHPSEEAVAQLRERLTAAADEIKRRQILAGWQGYFGQALTDGCEAIVPVPKNNFSDASSDECAWTEPWWSEAEGNGASPSFETNAEALILYRERFVGRSEVFARHWRSNGRKGYAPVRRPITEDELRAHLAGQLILGTYLLHPDGTTKALVLDIDGPNLSEAGQQKAFQVTQQLVQALRQHNITPIWVDSGGKGYHLWLCFRSPTPTKVLRHWVAQWLDGFRPFPEGVFVEVFPKQDSIAPNALGALIRLPMGKHPETERRSILLTLDGQPASNPWAVLAATPLIDPETLLQVSNDADRQNLSLPQPPEAIAPMVKGCALIWGLVKKAGQTHHLRHIERLSLLYTLGHCGEAGQSYLHQVIALCSNYNPRITQRWIQRLDEGHRPIRCATLREWLKDCLPGVTCPCIPKVKDPTPLDLLRQAAKTKTKASPPQPEAEKDAWEEVADEIFGEMRLSD